MTSLVEFPYPQSRKGYMGLEKKELLADEEEDWVAGWSLSKWVSTLPLYIVQLG